MQDKKLIGLVLLVVGIVLLFFGWQSSGSLGDQLTESLTGRFTDQTMLMIVSGVACLVAGIYLTGKGK